MKDYYSWEYYALDKIQELARADPDYQEFRREYGGIITQYTQLLRSLTPRQQELLVDYECCLGNLCHIETMIAYELGRNTPRMHTDFTKAEKNSCNRGKSML